jgi:hypothetical protein
MDKVPNELEFYAIQRIHSSDIILEPFPHLLIDGPDGIYSDIV